MLRRTAGSTICALLLQLNLASSTPACQEHRGQPPEPSPPSTQLYIVTGEMTHHDHESDERSAPCDTPVQTDCCQALASCSITLSPASSGKVMEPDVASRVVAAFGVRAPAYLIRAPEPPPPKA